MTETVEHSKSDRNIKSDFSWDFNTVLAENFEGDIPLFCSIIEMFLSNKDKLFSEMVALVHGKNFVGAAKVAHRMKGTALMFSYTGLVQSLIGFEESVATQNNDQIGAHLMKLQEDLNDFTRDLRLMIVKFKEE